MIPTIRWSISLFSNNPEVGICWELPRTKNILQNHNQYSLNTSKSARKCCSKTSLDHDPKSGDSPRKYPGQWKVGIIIVKVDTPKISPPTCQEPPRGGHTKGSSIGSSHARRGRISQVGEGSKWTSLTSRGLWRWKVTSQTLNVASPMPYINHPQKKTSWVVLQRSSAQMGDLLGSSH